MATTAWKTMTAKVKLTNAILTPIKSIIIPQKKGKIMLGSAITV